MDQKHTPIEKQIVPLLLAWYEMNARDLPWRMDRDPYHVWVSEIMLQQTRVEAVKGYYTRFLSVCPTVNSLASAEEETLLKLWEGLGYYSRVRNLQRAAQVIIQELDGKIPTSAEELEQLPGIGAYTAGAIASICFDEPAPAVDGNVLRVMARLHMDGESIDRPQTKKRVMQQLRAVYPKGKCAEFTQSLMELGATICLPNGAPLCTQCPIHSLCQAHQNGIETEFPVRDKKKPRRVEQMSVFALICSDTVAVHKRENGGLLGGLWEFPNGAPCKTEAEAIRMASDFGTAPYDLIRVIGRSHIFTHVEWKMTCYLIRCANQSASFTWVDAEQLRREIALPTAFRQFLPEVLALIDEHADETQIEQAEE